MPNFNFRVKFSFQYWLWVFWTGNKPRVQLRICSCFSGWLWNTMFEIIFWPLGTHCKWQHGVTGLFFTTDVWLLCLVPIRNILLTSIWSKTFIWVLKYDYFVCSSSENSCCSTLVLHHLPRYNLQLFRWSLYAEKHYMHMISDENYRAFSMLLWIRGCAKCLECKCIVYIYIYFPRLITAMHAISFP